MSGTAFSAPDASAGGLRHIQQVKREINLIAEIAE
jgi:hypothetical protein